MEYTRDVVAVGPSLANNAVSGTAALFVADREVEGGALRVVSEGLTGGDGFFAVFLVVESDTSMNRARSFWKRHPDIAARGETWEQGHTSDGTITRVALLGLADSADIRDALSSSAVPSRQRVLVVTAGTIDADVFAAALAADPALMDPDFRPRGLVPWLLRAGLGLGVVVVRPEDGADGSAGFAFYGNGQQIARIRAAVSPLLASGE